jgi:hypothetical protein
VPCALVNRPVLKPPPPLGIGHLKPYVLSPFLHHVATLCLVSLISKDLAVFQLYVLEFFLLHSVLFICYLFVVLEFLVGTVLVLTGRHGRAGLDVGPVGELLGAAVEVAHADGHGLLPQQPHGRHGHEGEEEVDHVLTCLHEYHAWVPAWRDEQLHGQRCRHAGAVTVIGGLHRLRSSTANELCVARSTSSCYTAHIHIHMARRVDLASEFSVIDMWAPRPTRPCRLISSSLFLQSRRVVQHIYQIHVHQTFC